MSRRKIPMFNSEVKGYCVLSSSDIKSSIFDKLINNLHYKYTPLPIIINGKRYFSLYKFNKDNSQPFQVLMLNRDGIKLINKVCRPYVQNKDELYAILYKYLNNHISKDNFHEIQTLLHLVAKLYYENTLLNYDDSLFSKEYPTNMQLCIYYPLTPEFIRTITNLYNEYNGSYIMKFQLMIS